MNELQEIKDLLGGCGLSKLELLRELCDDVTDNEGMKRCTMGCSYQCTSCRPGCSNGSAHPA